MRSTILYLLVLLLFSGSSSLQGQGFFTQADRFFSKYVENGRVDYQAVRDHKEKLDALTRQMKNFSLSGKSKTVQKAFWINAYNLSVIKIVVRHYPVSNPQEVEGFFSQVEHPVAGQRVTLDEIENKKIRGQFNDPRIHFVLVCAAVSCPPIIDAAYQPRQLDQQLEERTRENLNDPDFIRVKPGQNKVLISEIFKWYQEDFVTSDQTVIDYINQYREEKIPSSYEVEYYTYDWTLNDTKKN